MSIPGAASPLFIGAAAAEAAAYQIDRSLRFNSSDSAFLSRTPSSAGNRRTFTFSCWVKRNKVGHYSGLFGGADGSNTQGIYLTNDDEIYVPIGGQNHIWSPKIRDLSAWYHIVTAVDTTQSTNTDRIKTYINGVALTSSDVKSAGWPSQDVESSVNNTGLHTIGRNAGNTGSFGEYYLAEVHFVDGAALAASDFGEYDDNNNWNPKDASGLTFGTNGFHLDFSDNSSNSALGTDSSGNSNTWTVNNINAGEGGTAISSATGAIPILNTSGDQGGTATSGVRSDSDSSNIVLALPLNGSNGGTTITDYHHTIKGSGSAKTVSIFTGSASGGAVTSTAESRYYGSSFYAVRGGTNDYTASDYIYRTGDTDLNLGTGDFCVEFWYYPQSMVSNSVMFDNRHESNSWPNSANGFALIHNAGGSIFSYSGGNQIIAHGNKLTANQWNHVAYTRDSGTERLFVNGDFFSTTASSSRNYNEGRFHLGSSANNGEGTSGYYQGLRIYKGTPKYTSNFTIPEAGDPTEIDSMIDTPTNYTPDSGNAGGNYATLNALNSTATLSNGNLDQSGTGNSHATIRIPPSGKWYYELTVEAQTNGFVSGIQALSTPTTPNNSNSMAIAESGARYNGDGSRTNSFLSAFVVGDTLGVAIDQDGDTINFYRNGTAGGSTLTPSSLGSELMIVVHTNATTVNLNFGQRPFAYTPPTGHVSLCTQNFADPTIADGSTAMDATLYTGTKPNSQTITGINHSPDFVWIKNRQTAYQHMLFDVVRGTTKILYSSLTNKEAADSNTLTAFTSDGFTLAGNDAGTNNTNEPLVAWTWDGGTSTVSNTDGSITSNVRASQTNGFSIVTYTDPTSGNVQTVGHGLNAAPEFIIVKSRTGTTVWLTYHKSLGKDYYTRLDDTDASYNVSNIWGNAEPTSSVFGVKGDNQSNMVAYCWTSVNQFSSFGSYEGNGSSDGPFVHTGFRPAWVLYRNADAAAGWQIYDSARDPFNQCDARLQVNSSGAEDTEAAIDILSNGFKQRATHTRSNASGNTYIYAAFAEHPFKTARAR